VHDHPREHIRAARDHIHDRQEHYLVRVHAVPVHHGHHRAPVHCHGHYVDPVHDRDRDIQLATDNPPDRQKKRLKGVWGTGENRVPERLQCQTIL